MVEVLRSQGGWQHYLASNQGLRRTLARIE
jgi:hypothetical protein